MMFILSLTIVSSLVGLVNGQWINEFHYDNAGTDQGEFIEVAYPTGSDISMWQIYLYNQNVLYGSPKPLSSCTSSNSISGITLSYCDYPTNGIQNGGRDAIALVNNANNQVLDFISYEGAVKATNGPAINLTPINVGVSESSSTPLGFSLQKSGSGCSRNDFVWKAAAAATKGRPNNSQVFQCGPASTKSPTRSPTKSPTRSPTKSPTRSPTKSPTRSPTKSPTPAPITPAAWLNEFHYDNSGTDVGEFIEVAYTGLDITSYTIVLYNGNGGSSYKTVSVPSGVASGNIFLSVIAFPTDGIQNGAPDGIALVNGSGTVVEFLSYEGAMTATNGAAAGLAATPINVSETSNTPVGYSLQRTGSGCQGSDFTWMTPRSETRGSLNSGQSITCSGASSPVPPPVPVPVPVPAPIPAPTPVSVPVAGPSPVVPTSPVTNTSVKIMTYNILAGGTADTKWKDIVKAENADIVVFTETGNWDDNNNQLLNQNVNEFNAFFSGETPYQGSTVQGISFANSANAIMTRFPIVQTTQLTDNELTSSSAHDLMVWKLDVGSGKFVYVIGIHLKCCGGATNDSRRNNTMQALLNWIDANISASAGIIMMGDFNSVSPVDTDPTFPGYQSDFQPSSGSTLNNDPLRMLLDPSDSRASAVHTFKDAFREANPVCDNNSSCCADTLCDSSLPGNCDERGYSYVGSSHNYDSRIDFIIVNQQVVPHTTAGSATVGDVTGNNVCVASDHLNVDAIVAF